MHRSITRCVNKTTTNKCTPREVEVAVSPVLRVVRARALITRVLYPVETAAATCHAAHNRARPGKAVKGLHSTVLLRGQPLSAG